MIVWHVTTVKKLKRYLANGGILPPVRAWKDIREAQRFSIQTGRRVILRLKVPDDCPPLKGHKGKAIEYPYFYSLEGF